PLQVGWVLDSASDDSLRAALIEFFGTMQQNGQLSALEDRYFGHVRKFDFVDTRAFMRAVNKSLPAYKEMFIAHAGDIDWRLIAAIAYQESHWNPKAVSPTGVRGLMMLTRGTAKDMGLTDRTDAEQSISGGSRYFASLLRRIPARVENPDRIWMAMAAYNVGLGHLEDARRITETMGYNPDLWIDVKKHLPLLRQKKHYQITRYGYARGDEAVNYVENIRRYYDSIVFLESESYETEENVVIAENASPPEGNDTVGSVNADNADDEDTDTEKTNSNNAN
ncbi:MAG: membrane-bound lytic murein transglycosylase MltF, partial [Pseudomonadota bacterium]